MYEVDFSFFPSFSVQAGAGVQPIATYAGEPNRIAVAEKSLLAGGSVIYSASPNLPPGLIRYAIHEAKAFQYTNTEDVLYLDQSFVALHTMAQGQIQLNLPVASALYEVFRGMEYPPSTHQSISVEANQTYLFFRGSQMDWNAVQ